MPHAVDPHDLPGTLPPDNIPAEVDFTKLQDFVEDALQGFNISNLAPDALWRDWMGLNPQVRTHFGAEKIARVWQTQAKSYQPFNVQAAGGMVSRFAPGSAWVDIPYVMSVLDAAHGRKQNCSGSISLVPSGESWKIWMITSILENFDGQGSPDAPPKKDQAAADASSTEEYDAVIVGAGQNGLCLAGRLAALQMRYILIESGDGVGHSWATKYDSTTLHTVREMNNLPFGRTFLEKDPNFMHKDDVVKGFKKWTQDFNINVRLCTAVEKCTQNAAGKWQTIVRARDGTTQTLKSSFLAFCNGGGTSTKPVMDIPGWDTFKGKALHTFDYKNASAWKGLRGVVVGAATCAHDVTCDMVDAGLSEVTMVQRSPSGVFPLSILEPGQAALFNTFIPTDMADRAGAIPEKIMLEVVDRPYRQHLIDNSERYAALEKTGFLLDHKAALNSLILTKFGGHFVDIEAVDKILQGQIKIRSKVSVRRFVESGVQLSDGSVVEADVVVFAIGYERSYKTILKDMLDQDTLAQLGDFWGLDEEGELRGIMKPAAPGLWLMAGAIPQARWYSRFVALQMQAELLERQS